MTGPFHSNGKLLITGEYAVLDGARALALPTRHGQSLTATAIESQQLKWTSFDQNDRIWFETTFNLGQPLFQHKRATVPPVAETLSRILMEARRMNPKFLHGNVGYRVETRLGFPRDWGLGSSSTLINNIAQWAQVDAYRLLWNAFSGSGYDIACAQNDSALLYQLENGVPKVEPIRFEPPFRDQLFFVHLNKKQDSREGIAQYRNRNFDRIELVGAISQITEKVVHCNTLLEFEALLTEHEDVLSGVLGMDTVKKSIFPDFGGSVKSLGAWGGDFVLATGGAETPRYFKEKGYDTVIPYSQMIL